MNGSSGALLQRVGQISITAHDLERATAFYRDALGLALQFAVPPKMAFFECGGVRLMVAVPEGEGMDHPSSLLYFDVADIHEAHRVLSERGVGFLGEPHAVAKLPAGELWMAFFRDPEGNTLALQCLKPKA